MNYVVQIALQNLSLRVQYCESKDLQKPLNVLKILKEEKNSSHFFLFTLVWLCHLSKKDTVVGHSYRSLVYLHLRFSFLPAPTASKPVVVQSTLALLVSNFSSDHIVTPLTNNHIFHDEIATAACRVSLLKLIQRMHNNNLKRCPDLTEPSSTKQWHLSY